MINRYKLCCRPWLYVALCGLAALAFAGVQLFAVERPATSTAADEQLAAKVAQLQRELLVLKRQQHERCWTQHVDFLRKPQVSQNEYEVQPFSLFTFSRLYPAVAGLGRRVVEKPIGPRRRELAEVIANGVASVNAAIRRQSTRLLNSSHQVAVKQFVEGITARHELKGT